MQPRPVTPGPTAASARPYEPNAVMRWVYRRFFRHIKVDERWSRSVRDSAHRGVVVYVMRSISILDFVCLDFLVKRFGLPLVRFVNDLGLGILEPFGKGGRRLRFRRQIPEQTALRNVVEGRFSALLFLRKPGRIGSRAQKGRRLEVDLIRTLVETQRTMSQPIFLVPQTFIWSMRPRKARRGIADFVFGPVEWPGRIRVFFRFLLNYRNARLRAGDSFDLKSFLDQHPDLSDAQLSDKVRYALLRRIERERDELLGPRKKSAQRIQDELLRSPRVRRHLTAEARTSGKTIAKVEAGARRELRRLCANQTPFVLGVLDRFFDWVWNRIYDGLVVDKEGIERLRSATRDGALVLLPSHKSHIDYLVLSSVLFEHGLIPPLIAAGDNLNFFPVGGVLRRGGAFFIRRSFRGRKLYAALVDAYIRKLLVEGFPIEFFIEGGRSRTGKLLEPKYGLLSMVVDAATLLRNRNIYFVPISIGYERVIEARSYMDELHGADKKRENVGNLLRTSKVLRSKYGRLYVQFGEIFRFGEVLAEYSEEEGRPLSPSRRRALIQRIAHMVTHRINQVTTATPAALVATALLTHQKRGMAHSELFCIARGLVGALRRAGAPIAEQIVSETGEPRDDVLREAVRLFIDAGSVREHREIRGQSEEHDPIYRVPDQRRVALEYYKNNVLHFLAPRAFVSAALYPHDDGLSVADLRDRVRDIAHLLVHEFPLGAEAPFEDTFDATLRAMVDAGEVVVDETRVSVAGNGMGRFVALYADLLRPYFESYLLALRGLRSLHDAGESNKDWLKRTMALGERMYLQGELEHREAITQPKLDGALRSLKEAGLVKSSKQGLRPGPKFQSPEDLATYERCLPIHTASDH